MNRGHDFSPARVRRTLFLAANVFAAFVIGAQPYTFTHFVGPDGGPAYRDASGTAARFAIPFGIVHDASGNLYVTDGGNHCIRRITPAGVVTTFAGVYGSAGSENGARGRASFNNPRQIAVDASGNLYVADMGNHLIRKVTPAGVVSTFAGTRYVSGNDDGPSASATFTFPTGIAINAAGDIYVAQRNHVIRKISGGVVSTFAGAAGIAGQTNSPARFDEPTGLAVDSSGNVYVADSRNYVIRKITPAGTVSTFAGVVDAPGTTDGTGSAARFLGVASVATDPSNNVWVSGSHTIRRITPAAAVTTFAGGNRGAVDAVGTDAAFLGPQGITMSTDGNLYVTEVIGHVIRKITPAAVVTTFAGKATPDGHAEGSGTNVRFRNPYGMEVDSAGSLFVADRYNDRIRKVTPAGVVSTFAGTGESGSEDGASGEFDNPVGVTVDGSGNVYVTEYFDHTIRKVTPAGVISTYAGSPGIAGSADATGTAAFFRNPYDLAVDSAGNVFVTDQANHTIRKITPLRSVTTFAGLAGSSGSSNGSGSSARFDTPSGIARDASNHLYVADTGNKTIRKITSAGVVTTFAGSPGISGVVDGTGSAARFSDPHGLTIDASGNLFVIDQGRIRRITPAGVVTTIGGGGFLRSEGTGSVASFHNPRGIAISPSGTLYVSENDSHTIVSGRPALATAATIDVAEAQPHVTRQLNASPAASSYAWSIVRRPAGSSATLSSTTVANPTFTPDKVDTWVFRLDAGHTSGRSITEVQFAGQCSVLSISPASLPDGIAGEPYAVTFTGSGGTGPYTFEPSTGYVPPGFTLTAGGALNGTPAAGTYGISIRMMDSAGCTSDAYYSFTIYPYRPPTGLVAHGGTSASVYLTWNAVSGAAGYRIYRRAAGGGYGLVGESPTTAFTDFSVVANSAYLYYVTARDGSGNQSRESNVDVATTVGFTDGTLAGVAVKAAHVAQLRTGLNAFCTLMGTGTFMFADPSLTGVRIKASHLTELRGFINIIRGYAGLGAVTFTDPTLEGQLIKRLHMNQLRDSLR